MSEEVPSGSSWRTPFFVVAVAPHSAARKGPGAPVQDAYNFEKRFLNPESLVLQGIRASVQEFKNLLAF